MGAALGINMDVAYNIVHDSNMSKICNTEEEAKQTVEHISNNYELGDSPYEFPAYKKTEDGKRYIVYNASDSKILKSINFKLPDFTELLKEKM